RANLSLSALTGWRRLTLQIAEQVAHLLIVERIEQFLRHERNRRGLHFLDPFARQHRAFVLVVYQRDNARRLLDDEAGQQAAVSRRNDVGGELGPYHGARIDDIGEQEVHILAVSPSEIWTDLVAFAKERMASGASLGKEWFPLLRIA